MHCLIISCRLSKKLKSAVEHKPIHSTRLDKERSLEGHLQIVENRSQEKAILPFLIVIYCLFIFYCIQQFIFTRMHVLVVNFVVATVKPHFYACELCELCGSHKLVLHNYFITAYVTMHKTLVRINKITNLSRCLPVLINLHEFITHKNVSIQNHQISNDLLESQQVASIIMMPKLARKSNKLGHLRPTMPAFCSAIIIDKTYVHVYLMLFRLHMFNLVGNSHHIVN